MYIFIILIMINFSYFSNHYFFFFLFVCFSFAGFYTLSFYFSLGTYCSLFFENSTKIAKIAPATENTTNPFK